MNSLISPAELRALHDPVILDARFRLQNPAEAEKLYIEAHIPGAQRVDLSKDLAGVKTGLNGRHPLPTREALEHLFSRLGIRENSTVVAYDDTDHAGAARLWMLLRYMGFTNVRILNGGLQAWKAEGFPLETGPAKMREPATFPVKSSLVKIRQASELKNLPLYDVRAPERFRGEVEPIDPKAGHIPGAKNLPYASLMRDGKFLPAKELAEKFPREKSPVFYCGSGVTSCVLLFAAHLIGKEAELYPGSWSEWCSLPNAAVEKN